MTTKRFILDDCGELINLNNHTFVEYGEECCNLLNELVEENKKLKQQIKGFEGCSHNFGLLYDEAKNKVEELSKENKELNEQLSVMKSNGLKVLEFYTYKLKNTDKKEFDNAREELWIVKEVLSEMGVIKNG